MTFNELILGIIIGLELVFLKMFFFLDEVSRDSNDTIEEDPIGIDVKNEVIEDDFDVKGHIITEHKDIKRQIVKCTKPKRVLPNDENAIQNHINSGHNEEKQQSSTNSGTPKKIESETIPVELSAELCLGRKLNQVSFFDK